MRGEARRVSVSSVTRGGCGTPLLGIACAQESKSANDTVTLAVIGAVIGEFVGSDRGLGTLVLVTQGQFNEALKFAALLTLVALALTLYGSAIALERVLLRGRAGG